MSAPSRRFPTPTRNRELLAEPAFATLPTLIDANRRLLETDRVLLDGVSLRELRQLSRRELFATTTSQPVIVTGHQPELFHPGVWAKNFAACGVARRVGGVSLNLNVDNDVVKATDIRLPAWDIWRPENVKLATVAFAGASGEQTWETLRAEHRGLVSLVETVAKLTANWGYSPLLHTALPTMHGDTLGTRFVASRQHFERSWGSGNVEFAVSRLACTQAFQHFAQQLTTDSQRFREVYNTAVRDYRVRHKLRSRTHPVPDLTETELPFWRMTGSRREKATAATPVDQLRPRALTLTLFARLCVADFFIHGIGGGKYDEVTDQIIRDYFGLEPPAFQVCSATLHLPLPRFESTPDDLKRATRLVRDLHWNPHRHSSEGQPVHELVRTSPAADRAARRKQYRDFRALGEQLRPAVAEKLSLAKSKLQCVRAEVAANAILLRRDFAWVLYPEAVLRPFLQEVMERADRG